MKSGLDPLRLPALNVNPHAPESGLTHGSASASSVLVSMPKTK